MAYWTTVSDGYDVTLYRSATLVAKDMHAEELCVRPNSENPSTLKEIREAMKASSIVRFYRVDEHDWTYRAEFHKKPRSS